jgi:hypothetical protein
MGVGARARQRGQAGRRLVYRMLTLPRSRQSGPWGLNFSELRRWRPARHLSRVEEQVTKDSILQQLWPGPYWQAAGPQLTSGRGPKRRRSSATSNGVERIEIARKAPSQARRYDRANVRDQSCRARAHGARLSSHGTQPLPHRGMEPKSANM